MRRTFFFIVAIVFATTSYASIPRASMPDRASEDASAFDSPLPETRIRVSDVLAPFDRPTPSLLSRALRQGYEQASTTNASGLGRFLSVDPIMSAVPRRPQSWNRYAYALNNPLKFTDPTGMYVFAACTGDEKQCQADRDAFEKARQEQLKSSDESVRNAAAAYGELGDENGVTVAFATAKDLGAFGGDTTAQLVIGEQASGKYDVRILTGMRGSDLANATVHEGEHVRNAQTYVSALQRGVFDPSLNLRLYQTEMNAYMVSWAFARTNNLTLKYNGMTLKGAMPREQLRQEIDRFLRRDPYNLTPETLRCQISPCG